MMKTRSYLNALILIALVGLPATADSVLAGVIAVSRSSSVSSEASTLAVDYDTASIDGAYFGPFNELVESDGSASGTNYTTFATASASQQSDVLFEGNRLTQVSGGGEVHALAYFVGCHEFGCSANSLSAFSFSFEVVDDSTEFNLSYLSWALNGNGNNLVVSFEGSPISYYHNEVLEGGDVVFDSLVGNLGPGNYVFNIFVSAGASAICGEEDVGDAYFGFALAFPSEKHIEVRDGLDSPIANAQFRIARVADNPPSFTETDLGTVGTDSTGKFELPDQLEPGDLIKISKLLHSQPAVKHQSILGTIYTVTVDNAEFDSMGAMSYYELQDSTIQTVTLGHTTLHINLLVSIEWDAQLPYIESTEEGLRNMANYMYDVADGQVVFDTIVIVDDKEFFDEADIRVYASNLEWPRATPKGWAWASYPDGSPTTTHLPRKFFGTPDENRNKSFQFDPLEMNDAQDYRTRGHELGHYLFDFSDEYSFKPAGAVKCATAGIYGFMESQYIAQEPMASEMSTNTPYFSSPSCQNTDHWVAHGMSCWHLLQSAYEKTWGSDSIFARIQIPGESSLLGPNSYFVGPNEFGSLLDYDVGAQIVFPVTHTAPSSETYTIGVINAPTLSYVGNTNVKVLKTLAFPPYFLNQGNTADTGFIRVLGVDLTDVIYAGGYYTFFASKGGFKQRSVNRQWLYGEADLSSPGKSRLGNNLSFGPNNEAILSLLPVIGNYQFVPSLTISDASTLLRIDIDTSFSELPTLEQNPDGSDMQQHVFSAVAGGYLSEWSEDLIGTGEMRIWAEDDSSNNFFVDCPYISHDVLGQSSTEDVFAADGSAILSLDVSTKSLTKAAILTSNYPILRHGLSEINLQAGSVQSISILPSASLVGDNSITIRYAESDLGDSIAASLLEPTLRIFRWNETIRSWELLGGSVDTEFNEVSSTVSEAGVYGAFTTEDVGSVPCGDVDSNNQVDITDAVFLINYIFAGGPAPQDSEGGDVDCNNQTDITDAVYIINYIFAGGASPCAACE